MSLREYHKRWEFDLKSSPERLWPFIADTNRFNRDTGVPEIEIDAAHTPLRIIANRPDTGEPSEYEHKLREARDSHHLTPDERVLFIEVRPGDVSEFSNKIQVTGVDVGGHHVLRCVSPVPPHILPKWTKKPGVPTGRGSSRRCAACT